MTRLPFFHQRWETIVTRLPFFYLGPESLKLLMKSAMPEQLPRIARLHNVLAAVEDFNAGDIDRREFTARLDVAFTSSDDDNIADVLALEDHE